jgi:hypothetical protein
MLRFARPHSGWGRRHKAISPARAPVPGRAVILQRIKRGGPLSPTRNDLGIFGNKHRDEVHHQKYYVA